MTARARRPLGLRAWAVMATFALLCCAAAPAAGESGDGFIENRAAVTYTDANGNQGSAEASAVITVARNGSLVIRKSVDRVSAEVGDTLRYTLRWTNLGIGPATALVITDTLPGAITLLGGSVRSDVAVTTLLSGSVLQFQLGEVPVGSSGSLSFAAIVNRADEDVQNFAVAHFDMAGGAGESVSDTARTRTGGGTGAAAALRLRKYVDRTLAGENDTLTYRISWRNDGPGRASGLLLTDSLPAGLDFIRATGPEGMAVRAADRVLAFTLPDVLPGDSAALEFQVRVTLREGELHNTATAVFSSEAGPGSAAADTVLTRLAAPEMRLELEALVDRPLQVGDSLTYRIRVINTHATLLLHSVVVTDSLPLELEYLGADPDPALRRPDSSSGGARSGLPGVRDDEGGRGGEVLWQLGSLAPGDTALLYLHTAVRAIGNGSLVNVATAAGAGISQALAAVATTAAEEPSDLVIRKAASSLEAGVGDAVVYTITLENTGVTVLRDIVLEDLPDAGIRIQSGSVRGASMTTAAGAVRFHVGTLAPGQTGTVRYAATLIGSRGDRLANRVFARTGSGLQTDTVSALVRLRAAALLTRVVTGKAWLDENGDGRQQATERPLSHALIWTASGETVRADSLGRFTFPDLVSGRHTFRLDPLAIPAGYEPSRPVTVRADGYTSPVVQFAVQRGAAPLMSRADSLAAGFLFATEAALRRPRIAYPLDGQVLASNRAFVRVEGEPAAGVKLLRDETPVAEATLRPDGTGDFLGIDVTPGPHVFTAVVQGSAGEERVDIRVHASGEPQRAERADSGVFRAGAERVLALRVLDRWHVPVAQQPHATVELSGFSGLDMDADPASAGTQVPVAETGMLLLRLRADSAGSGRVLVSFGKDVSSIDVEVLPEIRSLVLLAEGEIGVGATSASYGAAVARGALDEHTSVTLSYDSRRTRDRGFGGAFDPLGEARPAVLGDASTRMVLGAATTPLALRVERDRSWLQLGDVNTRPFGTENSPGAYSRALPGASALWRAGSFYIAGFGSSVAQQLVRQQLRGNGTSGPYPLGGEIRLGTDRVAVEVRDRNNASLVIARQELERFVDYDLDASTGTILLRRPLHAADASGNPQLLVALAERMEGVSAFVGGLRAQVTATPFGDRDSVAIGGAYIEDRSALGGHRIITADLAAATRLGGSRLEVSRGEAGDSSGVAFLAGAWLGKREGDHARLEWLRVGAGFANPASPRLAAGTEDMRFSARIALAPGLDATGGVSRQWFRAQGAERSQAAVGLARALGQNRLSLDVGLLDEQLARASVAARYRSVTSRLAYAFGAHSAWLEATRNLDGSTGAGRPSTYGLGLSYDVGYGVQAQLSQRLVQTDSTLASATTAALKAELPTRTRAWSEYQLGHNSAGQQAAVLVGVGQKLRVAREWNADLQYERREGLAALPETDAARALPFVQQEQDRWAASLGVAWLAGSNRARAELRGEVNEGEDTGRGYRIFGSAEAALSASWTLFARQDARASNRALATGIERTRAWHSILAAAFRPAVRSDLTGLFKLELRRAENPLRDGGTVLSGTDERIVGAFEVIWTPTNAFELGTRYAFRRAEQGGVLAGGSEIASSAHYAGGRARYRLSERVDVRTRLRVLAEQRAGLVRWDAAPAVGVTLIQGLELETGVRLGDLHDEDFAQSGGSGFYVTLGMNVTETSARSLADFWRSRLGGER